MQTELFPAADSRIDGVESIAPQVTLLRAFVDSQPLLQSIDCIASAAPFRQLQTRGGGKMSVSMTNCGSWGWHSDARGYRYLTHDPLSGQPWPAMPELLADLARGAAEKAGFANFLPDCCLVNRYAIAAHMGAHRDFDELDMGHPIVSVSIGLPATFLWHGASRTNKPVRVALQDGDVLVWGGAARAGYHAVSKIKPQHHDAAGKNPAGELRFNLTFRRAK